MRVAQPSRTNHREHPDDRGGYVDKSDEMNNEVGRPRERAAAIREQPPVLTTEPSAKKNKLLGPSPEGIVRSSCG